MEGKKAEVQKTQEQGLYPQAQSNINQMLQGTMGNTQAYGGQLTAPLNSLMNQGYQSATNYANQPLYTSDPLFKQSTQNLQNILNPSYLTQMNPMTQYLNQYASSVAAPQAEASLANQYGRMGPLSSSGYGKATQNLSESLGETLQGNVAQQLTQNQSVQNAAIPLGMSTAQNIQNAPAQQAQTLEQLGAPYQDYANQGLQAQYQEWVRQQNALTSLSQQMQGQYPQYNYTTTAGTNSPFSQYVAPALNIAGAIASPVTGGINFGQIAGNVGNQFAQNYGQGTQGQGASSLSTMLAQLMSQGGGQNLGAYQPIVEDPSQWL